MLADRCNSYICQMQQWQCFCHQQTPSIDSNQQASCGQVALCLMAGHCCSSLSSSRAAETDVVLEHHTQWRCKVCSANRCQPVAGLLCAGQTQSQDGAQAVSAIQEQLVMAACGSSLWVRVSDRLSEMGTHRCRLLTSFRDPTWH